MTAPFSTRAVFLLILVGGIAFVGAMLFSVFGDEFDHRIGVGPNSYSESALGHRAFVEMLRKAGYPVLVSHAATRERVGNQSLLILAEPSLARVDEDDLRRLLAAPMVLLILPKRTGRPDPKRRKWVGQSSLAGAEQVEKVLRLVDSDARLERPNGLADVLSRAPGPRPDIDQPQVIGSDRLNPQIGYPDRMLLASISNGRNLVWVLSDPDIIANHGIGRGDNALFITSVIDRMLPRGGSIVIDETIHGLARKPSFARRLFDLPYVVVMFQLALGVVVLLLAATRRFGAPERTTAGRPRGQRALIESAVDLIRFGGHQNEALARYLAANRREVVDRYGGGEQDGDGDRLVTRIEAQKNMPLRLRDLASRVAEKSEGAAADRRVLATAQLIHDWKQGILYGPRKRQQDR